MATQKITSNSARLTTDQASIQYVIDSYYQAYPHLLTFEAIIPITIESLKIDEKYLITVAAPRAPMIALAPLNDRQVIYALARKRGRHKHFDFDNFAQDADINVKLQLDNIDFSVYNYKDEKKGKLIQQLTLSAWMTGFVSVVNGNLSVAALNGDITANAQPDPIAGILMKVLIDILQRNCSDLPLPQVERVLGAAPVINRAYIENQQLCAEVSADITYVKPIVNAAPGENKSWADASRATIIGSTQAGLINELSAAFIKLPEYSAGTTSEVDGMGISARLFAGVKHPEIVIVNGQAYAQSEAGAYAAIGVKICGEVSEIRLTPGTISVKTGVKLHVSADGKAGYLTFEPDTNSVKFTFGLGLPSPFNLVAKPIEALLNLLVSGFATWIYNSFVNIKLPLFVIEEPAEIFEIPFSARIDKLEFADNKVVATLTGEKQT
jgi:hypothetical protein